MENEVLRREYLMSKQIIDDNKKIRAYFKDESPTVGKKMTYCRLTIHFTIEEMADFLETTPEELEQYEKDEKEPPLQFLYLYAFYFEIHMENFVNETLSMPQFMVTFDVFHFAKFYTIHTYINDSESDMIVKALMKE